MSTLNSHPHSIHTIASTRRDSQRNKRATVSNDFKPSDSLIERFQIWKSVCNSLIIFFTGVSRIETNTSNELYRLGDAVHEVLPLRTNLFMTEGGLQDILYGIRDNTQAIAEEHDAIAKTVNSSIVLHLEKLKKEVKLHIRNIMQDTGKLASLVAAEREASTKLITSLARSIALVKSNPIAVESRQDPWLCNHIVLEQLRKQVYEENMLQKSILIMQTNSAQFEEALVRAIQTVWSIYDEYNDRKSVEVHNRWANSTQLVESISPNTEWLGFSSRKDSLLDPDTPLRNPQNITYPGDRDPSTMAIHQGILQRKKRFTKSYAEGYFVVTPAGYLHEFKSSDLSKTPTPELSIFLFDCTLSAPTPAGARNHKFTLILGKRTTFVREQAYTFRTRSHAELMGWWEVLKELCKVYFISSVPKDRSGGVPAAVLAVGYGSDEEEQEDVQTEENLSNEEVVSMEAVDHTNSSVEEESSFDTNEEYSSPISASVASSEISNYITTLEKNEETSFHNEPKVIISEGPDFHSEHEPIACFSEPKQGARNHEQEESFGGRLSRFKENFGT